MSAAQQDMFSSDGAAGFIASLPCLRCFIQLGLVWSERVAAIETPWGHIPACEKHAPGASSAFGWRKSNVAIDGAAADLAAARNAPDPRRAARLIYDRERNRALCRPLDAPIIVETPRKGGAYGAA